MVVAILILALAVVVIQERVSLPEEALSNSSKLTPLCGENAYLNGKNVDIDKTVRIEDGDAIETGEDS